MEYERFQKTMVAFVRAFGLHQPGSTPCGQPVSVSEAHALMELASWEPLSQSELTVRLRLEKSTVSRLVQHLEHRRWIARGRSPEDGRLMLLSLTEEGRRVAGQVAAARVRKYTRILDQIPPDDQEAVFRAIAVLIDAIQTAETGEG